MYRQFSLLFGRTEKTSKGRVFLGQNAATMLDTRVNTIAKTCLSFIQSEAMTSLTNLHINHTTSPLRAYFGAINNGKLITIHI